jgi:hypothetical protein
MRHGIVAHWQTGNLHRRKRFFGGGRATLGDDLIDQTIFTRGLAVIKRSRSVSSAIFSIDWPV